MSYVEVYSSGGQCLSWLLEDYYSQRRGQPLGLWFVNKYIKGHWPELCNEACTKTAIDKIDQWLMDNGYMHKLPPEIRKDAVQFDDIPLLISGELVNMADIDQDLAEQLIQYVDRSQEDFDFTYRCMMTMFKDLVEEIKCDTFSKTRKEDLEDLEDRIEQALAMED